MIKLALPGQINRIGEGWLVSIHQAADMIPVHVRDHNMRDILRLGASFCQCSGDPRSIQAGIEQNDIVSRPHERRREEELRFIGANEVGFTDLGKFIV